ncbi:type IV pilus biogenesis/stability protein PilW [Herbaspirillum lusitanum]|uniref:type IV pilus biogenesis/stability protein PilW n=1 Tax=Herbaspirillum lusitanum TaxID=213312 RepID=UPI0002D27A92|nr:type IV pilus biogenesis/stability protein PilW [Herbaspirillum lusitanum]
MRKRWQNSVIALLLAPALLLTGCVSSKMDKTAAGDSMPVSSSRVNVQADARKRADIRLQLAIGYYEQRQFAVTLEEADLALQAVPDFAEAYGMRALALMEMGRSRQAEADFLQALRLSPGNPDFANNYGWFLCNNSRAAEAIPYFEAAVAQPTYLSPGKALANAGACSLKSQNAAAAERYFARAFQYEPASLATNVNLTRIYFDRSEFERARFHIGLAAKNDVLNVDALWLAIKIERKLGNQSAENELAAQLRRRYPSSSEYAAYQRGAFDE